jgi:hypothetical protein
VLFLHHHRVDVDCNSPPETPNRFAHDSGHLPGDISSSSAINTMSKRDHKAESIGSLDNAIAFPSKLGDVRSSLADYVGVYIYIRLGGNVQHIPPRLL